MSAISKLGGVVLTALVLNFAVTAIFGYPLVYCMFKSAFAPFAVWLVFANMTLVCLMCIGYIVGGKAVMVNFVLGIILLNALPSIVDSAFGLGFACPVSWERVSGVPPVGRY